MSLKYPPPEEWDTVGRNASYQARPTLGCLCKQRSLHCPLRSGRLSGEHVRGAVWGYHTAPRDKLSLQARAQAAEVGGWGGPDSQLLSDRVILSGRLIITLRALG